MPLVLWVRKQGLLYHLPRKDRIGKSNKLVIAELH